MNSIKLNMNLKKCDKNFLEYYSKDKRISIMAMFICALGNTRNELPKDEHEMENYDLLSETMSEFWDEIDAWNEMEDR